MKRTTAERSLYIEWHRPSVEFWIQPEKQPGQWVSVSRFEGRVHVRGTYNSVPANYERIARTAYEAMERGFKSVSFGREQVVKARIRDD